MEKAWEGSWTRKGLVIIFTYLSISLYLYFIVGIDPWINAVVPAIGFLLSTLTLPNHIVSLVSHERIHHGELISYLTLGGFELPKNFKQNWAL